MLYFFQKLMNIIIDYQEKTMRRTCNFPPPDSYNPDFSQGSKMVKSPNWGFGSSKRGNLQDGKCEAPSMQRYNIPSRAVEGSTWSMGAKLDNTSAIGNSKTKFVPGPGSYEPNYKAEVNALPQYSIKGRYKAARKLDVPGPGTYGKSLVDKQTAPSYGFGSSPQREPIKKTLSPGPGGYRIPSMIAEVPAYAMPNQKDEFKYI